MTRSAYRQVKHFFPLSQAVADELREEYGVPPDRITPVGSGRGSIAANSDTAKDYSLKQVLFVGKQRFREKGGPLLLEAMRIVADLDPGVRLTLVGQPRDLSEADMPPNVKTVGFLSQEELEAEFHRASLFAMPAPWEPWGLVYLEALASKTPILGLRRNAFPELCGDGEFGIIVDEPDPPAVANAIVSALAEPTMLRSMAEAGQRHVLEHRTWQRTSRLISENIENRG